MKEPIYVTNSVQRAIRLRMIEQEEAEQLKRQEAAAKNHDFVQFTRPAMSHFVSLIRRSPAAAQVLVALAGRMNRENAIVASMAVLGDMCSASRATMSRAISLLCKEKWIERQKVGATNSYVINSRIFWTTSGDRKRSGAIFSANITVDDCRGNPGKKSKSIKARNIPVLTGSQAKPIK